MWCLWEALFSQLFVSLHPKAATAVCRACCAHYAAGTDPTVYLHRTVEGLLAKIAAKLEFMDPIGYSMATDAEQPGHIRPHKVRQALLWVQHGHKCCAGATTSGRAWWGKHCSESSMSTGLQTGQCCMWQATASGVQAAERKGVADRQGKARR